MVMLIEYIPAKGTSAGLRLHERLGREDQERLARLGEFFVRELAPLTKVNSASDLRTLLARNAPSFGRLKRELFDILLTSSEGLEKLAQDLQQVYAEVRELSEQRKDILSGDLSEQLLGVLDSIEGLNAWAFEAFRKGDIAAMRTAAVAPLIGQAVLFADACLTALLLILTDTVKDWSPKAVRLLCATADNCMAEVEDVFLSLSPPLGARLAEDARDYEQVRGELGL